MATGFRAPLGLNLANIVEGDQPPMDMGDFGRSMPGPMTAPIEQPGGFFKEGGLGRYIAGAIGDALLQNAGMRPVFAPMQQQRQQMAAEDAIWTRRQALQRDQNRADKEWEWAHKPHEPSAMERNLSTWQSWTPEQQAAYRDFNKGDPFVTTTLPNGQFYAGPQSGLIGALTGQVQPSTQPKVGDVVADPRRAGGGAGNSVGGFRP